MSKRIFITLFLLALCVSLSSAQTVNKQWEYLEVSQVQSCYVFSGGYYASCRNYNFFNEGKIIQGTTSLDWLGKSGWDLVGATSAGEDNSGTKLVFKRSYDKSKTDREIEELQKTTPTKPKPNEPINDLIDLDSQEAKQKLDEFNRQEEERLRNALSKLNNSAIKVVNVKAAASELDKTSLASEIVVDGTSVLLKDGNKYRSSEAKSYWQEIVKQVSSLPELNIKSSSQNYTRFQIGKLANSFGNISIGITVTVNYKNDQIIVAQGIANGTWKEVKQ